MILQYMNRSSIYDLFRYSLTIKNPEKKEKIQEEAALQFFDPSFRECNPSIKKNLYQLLDDAIVCLLSDNPTEIWRNKTEEHSTETWNSYLQYTKKIANRSLKGFNATSKDELLILPISEIDIARGIHLEYHRGASYSLFEVFLDIIAKDSLIKIETDHNNPIDVVNQLLFYDLRIRFPPKHASEKYIDQFTNIEEIISSKRGVCLGVSVMYMAILQRMNIPYTIYTPPGHIFLSAQCVEKKTDTIYERVIETTARGIHIPLEHYLDSKIIEIPKRESIEVIGMILINDAAAMIQQHNFQKALELYNRSRAYIRSEKELLDTFTALTNLALGKTYDARKFAESSLKNRSDLSYEGNPLSYDIQCELLDTKGAQYIIDALNRNPQEMTETKRINTIHALEEYLHSLSKKKRPISLLTLQADLALEQAKNEEALTSLFEIYRRWKEPPSQSQAPFMSLSTLLLLSKLSYFQKNIPDSLLYAEEAFNFTKKSLQQIDASSIKIPYELEEWLLFLSKKSPGCLNKNIIF